MTNKWVFLYGGQGSQQPGMGLDFALKFPDDSFYRSPYCSEEELTCLLDPSFTRIHETRYAQVALTLFALTVTRLLQKENINPGAALGLSAGEFPALAAANVYSPEEALEIIKRRARLMSLRLEKRRKEGHDDGMLVVLGLKREALEAVLPLFPAVSLANINAETQLTAAGPKDDLELLRQHLPEAGAKRALLLEVEGAFHSKVFNPDVEELRKVLLAAGSAGKPQAELPLNILGRPVTEPDDSKQQRDADQPSDIYQQGDTDHPSDSENPYTPERRTEIYADLMSRQMSSVTRLDDCFSYLLDHGYTNFVEIAPQAVLTPLLRRRSRDLNLRHISSVETFNNFVAEIKGSQR